MKRIWVTSLLVGIFVMVGIYGCGVFKDPSTGPTFEVVGNSGPVSIDYEENSPGDYNTGDFSDSGCCDGDGGGGNLCSFPSCTDVPDEICQVNGGSKECQPCSACANIEEG